MIRLLIGILALSVSGSAFSQRSEVGFGLGAFTYTGDLTRTYSLRNAQPAATAFYRSNMSPVISFRAGLTGGSLSASDKRPIDALAHQRNFSFKVFILEASTVFEYHFLNWRDDRRPMRFTPYLMGGLGLFGISGHPDRTAAYSNVQAAVPFGGGIKYVLNPRFYLGMEFGARKTFFDYLDNISGGDQRTKNYQYANPNDNDSYYFFGITITRTFYDIPCPKVPY